MIEQWITVRSGALLWVRLLGDEVELLLDEQPILRLTREEAWRLTEALDIVATGDVGTSQ